MGGRRRSSMGSDLDQGRLNDMHTTVSMTVLTNIEKGLTGLTENVRSIKEDLIPPLANDVREARDTAREALQKIDSHILNTDIHGVDHCTEMERINKTSSDLSKVDERSKGTSKLLWWVLGVLVIVGGTAITIALASNSAASAAATQLETLDEIPEKVTAHDERIKAIETAREENSKTSQQLLQEMRGIATQLKNQSSQQTSSQGDRGRSHGSRRR